MTAWLATGALLYGGLLAGLYFFQRHLLYHPSASIPDIVQAGVPDMRPVRLKTADGLELVAWYKPPAPGKRLIVFFHGNAGHIGHRGFKARALIDLGHGMLLVSWRGFGGNQGSPSEEGLLADARAALTFASAQGIARRHVVLYGESLGSGMAVQLAAEQAEAGAPVGAVVLEAPYTSIAEVAQYHYFYVPARYMVADRYDSAARIGAIGAPLLVIHGERDRTVPVQFGRALFDAAEEPKQSAWLPEAAHNDVYDFGAAQHVRKFLEALQ
jgi:fermentation-respiration switch protein FrsA (DUF1100 family)